MLLASILYQQYKKRTNKVHFSANPGFTYNRTVMICDPATDTLPRGAPCTKSAAATTRLATRVII